MGTLYSGTPATREGLEAWLGYALEAWRFLDKHTPKAQRWILTRFAHFTARGEVFIAFRRGKICGAAIIGRCEKNLLESAGDPVQIVDGWGEGPILFCPFAAVAKGKRFNGGTSLLSDIIKSARDRFPDAEGLAFQRFKTGRRFHCWKFDAPNPSPLIEESDGRDS